MTEAARSHDFEVETCSLAVTAAGATLTCRTTEGVCVVLTMPRETADSLQLGLQFARETLPPIAIIKRPRQ